MVSQKPGFLSQNAGLRDAPRPYVRSIGSRQPFVPSPESPMSRRHLSFVLVAIASLVVSACSASPTGPRPTAPSHTLTAADSTPRIGVIGSGG